MSNIKYTLGNWVLQSDKENICVLGSRVAKAYDPVYPEKVTEQTYSNAKLICASPLMYEAIKKFIKVTEDAKDVKFSVRMGKAFCELRNAITKADGK